MEKLNQIAQQLLSDLLAEPNVNWGSRDRQVMLELIQNALERYGAIVALGIVKKSVNGVEVASEIEPSKKMEELEWKKQQFEIFWKKYDKKVGRTPALKKWMKLKRTDIEKVIATVEDFVSYHADIQFRPHPVTYINQNRWLDEVPTMKTPATSLKPQRLNTWRW